MPLRKMALKVLTGAVAEFVMLFWKYGTEVHGLAES